MARKLLMSSLLLLALAGLSGCGSFRAEQREAWREAEERVCLRQNVVRKSAHVTPRPRIDGPGVCGLTRPFHVTALANGAVSVSTRATLGCPMIAALDRWIADVVQPAALARFGQPVVELQSMASFACRRRNHRAGAKMSEHAFANALDIGAFRLADGRNLTILRDWRRGDVQEQAFLREVHAGACRYFRTVLGPGSDGHHEDHLHLDLAVHGNGPNGPRHYCRPVIKDIAPAPGRDQWPDAPWLAGKRPGVSPPSTRPAPSRFSWSRLRPSAALSGGGR